MKLVQSVPVEAVQLTPEAIRSVAEWIVPEPGESGYSWYEGTPARFRTATGELAVPMGAWIVRLGTQFTAFSAEEFELVFRDQSMRQSYGLHDQT